MWQAAQDYHDGTPTWTGEHLNRGLSIEEVISCTWQAQEQSPANAVPYLGGTLAFWCASLSGLQLPLLAFGRQLRHDDSEAIISFHPISGPLDVRQQINFLRLHLDRHRRQIGALFPQIEAKR